MVKNTIEKYDFQMLWPFEELTELDCCFYNIPIKEYISTTEVIVEGKGPMIMFGGYSYLSLHKHPHIETATKKSLEQFGSGGHGARLLAGTTSIHRQLERKISTFKGTEDAITYSTGYIANLSCISALVGRNDTILSDRLNHASILDGCQLSRAKMQRFRHNDVEHLEQLLK